MKTRVTFVAELDDDFVDEFDTAGAIQGRLAEALQRASLPFVHDVTVESVYLPSRDEEIEVDPIFDERW